MIVLDGSYLHATPPSASGVRASFYCAWVDKDIHKSLGMKSFANDYQFRLLDAIDFLTQDLATKCSAILKSNKLSFAQLSSKLVDIVSVFVSAEKQIGKVEGIDLEHYLHNKQFRQLCLQSQSKTSVKRVSAVADDQNNTKKHSK